MLISFFSFIGSLFSTACVVGIFDEPECPKSLIK